MNPDVRGDSPEPRASTQDGSYPRPQLMRKAWADLCGAWNFRFDDENDVTAPTRAGDAWRRDAPRHRESCWTVPQRGVDGSSRPSSNWCGHQGEGKRGRKQFGLRAELCGTSPSCAAIWVARSYRSAFAAALPSARLYLPGVTGATKVDARRISPSSVKSPAAMT